MGGIRFLLGIHTPLRVGYFPEVLPQAYQLSSVPCFDVLSGFPQLPVRIHSSGALCDWLEVGPPEFLDRPADFLARGQQLAILPRWPLGGHEGGSRLRLLLTVQSREAASR